MSRFFVVVSDGDRIAQFDSPSPSKRERVEDLANKLRHQIDDVSFDDLGQDIDWDARYLTL